MIPINPQDLKQTNRSDKLGSLWSTWNIDLNSNVGKLRVSPRLKVNKSTSDLANLGCPVAFAPFNTLIYAVAGSRIFVGTGSPQYPNVAFVEDTSTGAGTDYNSDYSDLCAYNDVLFSTSPSKLRSLDGPGGTWTERDAIAINDEVHKLCYFPKFNRLYWTASERFINSCSTDYIPTDTGDFTLTWTSLLASTDLKAAKDFLWIGGKGDNTSRTNTGIMRKWDGRSSDYIDYAVPGTKGVFAVVINEENDTPVAMGDNGILYGFNGSGFSEVGRLPFKQLPFAGTSPYSSSNQADRFIHPNGMVFTERGTVYAAINGKNNDNSGTQDENIPSGIWEFDLKGDAKHISPFTYDPITSSVTDYGQFQISRVGALALMNMPNTTSGRDGTLLAGATLFTDASSTTSVIAYNNSLDTVQKFGYIVTSKIYANGPELLTIEDNWNKIYTRHKKLLASTDAIWIKYRSTEEDPITATITWTSTTTFTTTTDVSAYSGYEAEILQGKGGGKCSKITSISESGGTYTVTLQETFTGATSGTAKARFQKWIEVGKQTSQKTSWFEASPLGTSTWIQFKVCMQFSGRNEVEDFKIANNVAKEAE